MKACTLAGVCTHSWFEFGGVQNAIKKAQQKPVILSHQCVLPSSMQGVDDDRHQKIKCVYKSTVSVNVYISDLTHSGARVHAGSFLFLWIKFLVLMHLWTFYKINPSKWLCIKDKNSVFHLRAPISPDSCLYRFTTHQIWCLFYQQKKEAEIQPVLHLHSQRDRFSSWWRHFPKNTSRQRVSCVHLHRRDHGVWASSAAGRKRPRTLQRTSSGRLSCLHRPHGQDHYRSWIWAECGARTW